MEPRKENGGVLSLRAGDVVEVRSTAEILATLDANGCRDALPFMPEMLQYCGQRFTVHKRAHKTCDTIWKTGARGMDHAVHLENIRCDGMAHGGCQAGCLIFWKEAWLKRVEPDSAGRTRAETNTNGRPAPVCSEATLYRATRRATCAAGLDAEAFSCQTTALFDATSYLRWWDVRQYIRDLTSRNVTVMQFARGTLVSLFNAVVRVVRRFVFALGHAVIGRRAGSADGQASTESTTLGSERPPSRASLVVGIRTVLENLLVEYPHVQGKLRKTPSAELGLRPGDYVQVRSREEIVETLDAHNRNRGLLFDVEMVPYCGGTYRVLRRVERILDERTGRMMQLPNNCLVLDGVVCGGCLSRNRLFCPRGIYPYWHEVWLERSGHSESPGQSFPGSQGSDVK